MTNPKRNPLPASSKFHESIEKGMHVLRTGTAPHALDVVPIDGAEVQAFDICDGQTGQFCAIWRVASRLSEDSQVH